MIIITRCMAYGDGWIELNAQCDAQTPSRTQHVNKCRTCGLFIESRIWRHTLDSLTSNTLIRTNFWFSILFFRFEQNRLVVFSFKRRLNGVKKANRERKKMFAFIFFSLRCRCIGRVTRIVERTDYSIETNKPIKCSIRHFAWTNRRKKNRRGNGKLCDNKTHTQRDDILMTIIICSLVLLLLCEAEAVLQVGERAVVSRCSRTRILCMQQ